MSVLRDQKDGNEDMIYKTVKANDGLSDVIVYEEERIDDLQLNKLRIIQNPKWFCFGIDAVLLSHFIKLKRNDTVVEFGTGTGIIPILLSGKSTFSKIYAFEVQADVADMANRSIKIGRASCRERV